MHSGNHLTYELLIKDFPKLGNSFDFGFFASIASITFDLTARIGFLKFVLVRLDRSKSNPCIPNEVNIERVPFFIIMFIIHAFDVNLVL